MTFRALAKQLHPDSNSGDHSRVIEFTELMRRRRNECKCGCGRQRPRNNGRFYENLCKLRYLYPQLKQLAAVILATACLGAGFQMPTKPVIKKKPVPLHSPRGAELYMGTAMAIVVPPKKYFLWWDDQTPLPHPPVEFDIEYRQSLADPWVMIGRTNQPPFPITTQGVRGMYRVGSHWK